MQRAARPGADADKDDELSRETPGRLPPVALLYVPIGKKPVFGPNGGSLGRDRSSFAHRCVAARATRPPLLPGSFGGFVTT